MRSYNEHVVKSLTKEQFLQQHPESGEDYDRIVRVKERAEPKKEKPKVEDKEQDKVS